MGPIGASVLFLFLFGVSLFVSDVYLFVKCCRSGDYDLALGAFLLWLIFMVFVCAMFNL